MAPHDPILQRIIEIIASRFRRKPADIQPTDKLQDLGEVDSLEEVELVMELEDEFGVDFGDGSGPTATVMDLAERVQSKLE